MAVIFRLQEFMKDAFNTRHRGVAIEAWHANRMTGLWHKLWFNSALLPKDSALHAIDLRPGEASYILPPSVFQCCSQDQCSLNSHTRVKWHIYCGAIFCLWCLGLEVGFSEVQEEFHFLCFGAHACCAPFCAEEEIHLPTGANCAHANSF